MEWIVWLIFMIPLSALFTGVGIFAIRRKKPMWFWSGSEVRAESLTDVRAYNRANGVMWIVYSLLFWGETVLGVFYPDIAGVLIAATTLGGIPILVVVYKRILKKYRKQ
ncbi:MAG: hypothetical protein J5765_01720 [Clostridia bacterium]|nr:hypothetical protein [Clostridia bacterium]